MWQLWLHPKTLLFSGCCSLLRFHKSLEAPWLQFWIPTPPTNLRLRDSCSLNLLLLLRNLICADELSFFLRCQYNTLSKSHLILERKISSSREVVGWKYFTRAVVVVKFVFDGTGRKKVSNVINTLSVAYIIVYKQPVKKVSYILWCIGYCKLGLQPPQCRNEMRKRWWWQ